MYNPTNKFQSRIVVLLTLGVLVISNLNAKKKAVDTNTQNAFMLGFVYGNGHNIYSLYPTLKGEAKSIYNDWMSDARKYANTLDVTLDISPPKYDTYSTTKQSDIIRAGRNKAETLSIQLRTLYNRAVASALLLGYKSAIAIEFLPHINSSSQAEVIAEYKYLAKQMLLPVGVVEKYTNALISTSDREQAIKAMFTFRDDVLLHYEGLTLNNSTGFKRQLNIWSMGWSLGLATLGQTRGADQATVARIFEKCRVRADLLGVSLPMLPEASTDDAKDTARAIMYLLNEAGGNIGDELKAKYGPRASSLFELSIKSTLTLLLYGSDEEMGQTLVTVIERSGRNADLPAYIYQPLVDKMRSKTSYSTIKEEISAMNERIRTYLNQ